MKIATKHDMRYKPIYTRADVSRYARVHPATLRTWTLGGRAAVIAPANDRSASPLSFVNLVEAFVLHALRQTHKVPLQRIRKALTWLAKHYNVRHPLAEIDLETDAYNLFVREMGCPISASEHGQFAFPEILDRYLKRIERDKNNIPTRFFPFTYDDCPKLVVMDPLVAFGRPVITATRISTSMIYERYTGGEAMADIAADYNLDATAIEEAVRCEIERSAA